jgi:hypothetical protein
LTQAAPEVANAVVEDGSWLQKQIGAAPVGLAAMQSPQLVGASQTDCAEHRARSADMKIKRSMVWAANAQAVAAQGVVVSEEGVRRKKRGGLIRRNGEAKEKSENAERRGRAKTHRGEGRGGQTQ